MDHDGGPQAFAPTKVVATWPKGSFAENVAVSKEGALFVSLHTDRAVERIEPASGAVSRFATFETPVAGLTFASDDVLYVGGGTPGSMPGVIWRVSQDGAISKFADIPDSAFLNGMTFDAPHDRLLVADSIGSRIYAIDLRTGAVGVWLSDPILGPTSNDGTPGANGIKLHDGFAYISVTGADRIVRCAVASDGSAGHVETFAEHLRADDFAVGQDGALYIATHPARSLVRLAPDGARTTLATAEHGMTGATAVAFGRTAADRHSLYVTTTGGTMTLPESELEPAKLVRVEVGVAGAA